MALWPTRLLPFPRMHTDERLRKRVLTLISKGVSHKVVAAKMGMSTSAFSKWLNRKSARAVSLDALDGFDAFVRELGQAIANGGDGDSDSDGERPASEANGSKRHTGGPSPPRAATAESHRRRHRKRSSGRAR